MWYVEKDFKIILGSNTYINTPNLVMYKGRSLFTVKRSDNTGLLGINFDVYDKKGTKVATIRNGIVVQGDKEDYNIREGMDHYSVTEQTTGRTICDIRKRRESPNAELEVSVRLYMPDGFLLDATPEQTNIGGNVIKSCTFRDCKAAIVIE